MQHTLKSPAPSLRHCDYVLQIFFSAPYLFHSQPPGVCEVTKQFLVCLFVFCWRVGRFIQRHLLCVCVCVCVCDVTRSYMWRASFKCVTWLIHICDAIHSYVWRDAFICVTWRIHMCDVTHLCVWHGLTRLEHVKSAQMCNVTYS